MVKKLKSKFDLFMEATKLTNNLLSERKIKLIEYDKTRKKLLAELIKQSNRNYSKFLKAQ